MIFYNGINWKKKSKQIYHVQGMLVCGVNLYIHCYSQKHFDIIVLWWPLENIYENAL